MSHYTRHAAVFAHMRPTDTTFLAAALLAIVRAAHLFILSSIGRTELANRICFRDIVGWECVELSRPPNSDLFLPVVEKHRSDVARANAGERCTCYVLHLDLSRLAKNEARSALKAGDGSGNISEGDFDGPRNAHSTGGESLIVALATVTSFVCRSSSLFLQYTTG